MFDLKRPGFPGLFYLELMVKCVILTRNSLSPNLQTGPETILFEKALAFSIG